MTRTTRLALFLLYVAVFGQAAHGQSPNHTASGLVTPGLYMTGVCEQGVCGAEVTQTGQVPIPLRIAAFKGLSVSLVAIGARNTAVVADGILYTFGQRAALAYAVPASTDYVAIPTAVDFFQGMKITALDLGNSHGGLIVDGNKLYMWGKPHFGPTGQPIPPDTMGPNIFTYVQLPDAVDYFPGEQVTALSLGSITTGIMKYDAALEGGRVFSAGKGDYGQRGDGTFTTEAYEFKPVSFGAAVPCRAIRYKAEHACAIVPQSGVDKVFCWGRNTHGQLGLGSGAAEKVSTPTLVPLTLTPAQKITQMTLGELSTIVVAHAPVLHHVRSCDECGMQFKWCASSKWVVNDAAVGLPSDDRAVVGAPLGHWGCHRISMEEGSQEVWRNTENKAIFIAEMQGKSTVYGFGDNSDGQQGPNTVIAEPVHTPTVIPLPDIINTVKVPAGVNSGTMLIVDQDMEYSRFDNSSCIGIDDSSVTHVGIDKETCQARCSADIICLSVTHFNSTCYISKFCQASNRVHTHGATLFVKPGINFVVDGDFSTSSLPSSWTATPSASVSIVPQNEAADGFGEGDYVAKLTGPDVSLKQTFSTLVAGENYTVKFLAESTSPVTLDVLIDDEIVRSIRHSGTTNVQHYTLSMPAASATKVLEFKVAGSETIFIDHVRVQQSGSVRYVDGPLVGNTVLNQYCDANYYDLQTAAQLCNERANCTWLHDYQADGENYRLCRGDITSIPEGDKKASTKVKQDTLSGETGVWAWGRNHDGVLADISIRNVDVRDPTLSRFFSGTTPTMLVGGNYNVGILVGRDCLGAWSEWGTCNATCSATTGAANSTFTIQEQPLSNGRSCPFGDGQMRYMECSIDPCPGADSINVMEDCTDPCADGIALQCPYNVTPVCSLQDVTYQNSCQLKWLVKFGSHFGKSFSPTATPGVCEAQEAPMFAYWHLLKPDGLGSGVLSSSVFATVAAVAVVAQAILTVSRRRSLAKTEVVDAEMYFLDSPEAI